MYKNIAWNNFCKTGNINSFMEYKKLQEILETIKLEDLGEKLNEASESEGDSNKGNTV